MIRYNQPAMQAELSILDAYWPYLGLLISCFVSSLLVSNPSKLGVRREYDSRYFVWIALVVYMVHQVEEYGLDALGRTRAFPGALCKQLGLPGPPDCPIPNSFYTAVNVGSVWGIGLLGVLLAYDGSGRGLALFGLEAVNAAIHLMGGIKERLYNPGLATALVLFIPISVYAFKRARRRSDVALAIAIGILVHAVLMGSLMGYLRGYYGQWVLVTIQVANGFVWTLIPIRGQ